MSHLNSFIQFLHHWLPRRHLLALAGLVLFLGFLSVAPDSSQDAQASNKTTVVLNSSGERRIAPVQITLNQLSNQESTEQADIPQDSSTIDDLDSILTLTDFRFETQAAIEVIQSMDNIEAETITAIEPEPTPATETRQIIEVKRGDNLSLIFYRAGLSDRDVYQVSRSGEHAKVLTRLFPGYQMAFDIDENQKLNSLEVITSPLESYFYTLDSDSKYVSSHELRTPELRQRYKEAVINDSLFLAAQSGGISAAHTMELAGIFGGVIDFILDTRKGDTFNILYEEKYLDGNYIGNGSILAAQFTNQGDTYTALRYTDDEGVTDYFNPDGESMRKAFLRNPVDFVRISSNFNPNRRHPISNTIRAHKGTDYAAPRGTPVVATADGRVTWAARNGSFGKLIVVKHNDRFETKYAHLNEYANGVRVGSRVRQGQVIGYVGSTGGATGPHLHYEFLMDGVHRNSRTIHDQLPKAESIASSELSRFQQQTQPVLAQLNQYAEQTQLALNSQTNSVQASQ